MFHFGRQACCFSSILFGNYFFADWQKKGLLIGF
jgi:hypothetical protein